MEKEKQGCLMWVGCVALMAVGVCLGWELDIPFLKNLSTLFAGFIGSYIGNTYLFKREKKTKRSVWLLYAVCIVLVSALFAWLLDGHLW